MGRIITITAPMAAGKTTLARKLLTLPNVKMAESTTTRERRDSDLPDEYRYLSERAFARLERLDYFLWTVKHGNYSYGTPEHTIGDILTNETAIGVMILVPEVLQQLAQHVWKFGFTDQRLFPLYLRPPAAEVVAERLRKRGDAPADIAARVEQEKRWDETIRRLGFKLIEPDNTSTPDVLFASAREKLGL